MQRHMIATKAADWQIPVGLAISGLILLFLGKFIAMETVSEGDSTGYLLEYGLDSIAWLCIGLAAVLSGQRIHSKRRKVENKAAPNRLSIVRH